jgi:hypothetical protein
VRLILLSVFVTAFISINDANAQQVSSYLLPITRAGQTNMMVAYNFWSTEYPGPVVNVNSTKRGTTTVQAFKSLRKLDTPVNCAIKNGIYHPWGKSPSLISWYTITPASTYTAKQPGDFKYNTDGADEAVLPLKTGDKLTRAVYLSEGFCQVSVALDGKETEVGTSCTNLEENEALENTVGGGQVEQWLYVRCADGTKAFIEDTVLLAQPGVKEGQITGYGSVSP